MKSVLIIGQNGQVSSYLQKALSGDYSVIVAGREVIDLLKVDQIKPALERLKPSLIINPAAFTAVDAAEQESAAAFTINRDAVAKIAEFCADTNTPLIHFSTDYVFDGDANTAYVETDQPRPTGVYGQSKLEGELAILAAAAPALILRTSWVYSKHGKNFYKTMLALAESRTELSVVADQVGAPTYAGSIAAVCKKLVEKILSAGEISATQVGVYHFSCQGQTSWAEFAKAIFSGNGLDQMVVNSITTAEYPTPAKRPAFSVLNGEKLAAEFDLSLPEWQLGLANCIAEVDMQEKPSALDSVPRS